jgi:polysaccharide pyruvyl transferase WcaK-like protein
LDIHHYATAHVVYGNSNQGDIAIRKAIAQQLTTAFAPRPVRFLEIKWGELTDRVATEINARCDLFVIAGGGYIFLKADGSPGHMLERVRELDKVRCPIFAYGIGLNRLMHEEVCALGDLPEPTREKIRYLGERCEKISVRDAETARLFALHSGKPVALAGAVLSAQHLSGAGPGRRTCSDWRQPGGAWLASFCGFKTVVAPHRRLPQANPA